MQLNVPLVSLLRVIAIGLPVLGALAWLQLETSVHFAFERICREIIPGEIGWGRRALGALVGAGHLGLLAGALITFTGFLKPASQQAYLSKSAVSAFHRFAVLFLVYLLTTPLLNVFASYLLTDGVAIVVNTDDLKLLGCGVLLLAVAQILRVAHAAKDENEHFI